MVLYQPGGLRERTLLLSFLHQPGMASSPEHGVGLLRKWHRWVARAQAMNASLPDAALLMAGIDQLATQVLQTHPNVAFRLNLVRTDHRLDHTPVFDSVVAYARALQSELEQAAISPSSAETSPKKPRIARAEKGEQSDVKGAQKGGDKGGDSTKGSDAKGSGGKGAAKGQPGVSGNKGGKGGKPQESASAENPKAAPTPNPPNPKKQLCAYYASDSGCNQGRACQYAYDQTPVPGAPLKCWTCGSIHHKKQDCPHARKPDSSQPMAPSQPQQSQPQPISPQPQAVATTPKVPAHPKTTATASAKALIANSPPLTADQILAEAAARLQNIRLAPLRLTSGTGASRVAPCEASKAVWRSSSGSSSALPGGALSKAEVSAVPSMCMLGGGTDMLNLSDPESAAGPTAGISEAQDLSFGEDDADVSAYGLIDSGATHALRYGTDEERSRSVVVEVELAQGTVQLWRNRLGVLLSAEESTLPILPMAAITKELKCKVQWGEEGCSVYHPALGDLPIRMLHGCPHIPRQLTLVLLSDLETLRANRLIAEAQARVLRAGGDQELEECWQRLRAIAFGGEPQMLNPQEQWEWCEGLYASLANTLASLFEGMPTDHLAYAIGQPDPAVAVPPPWNRRIRRRLERSNGVLIHLCSGKQRWKPVCHARFEVLEVEVQHGHDILSPSVCSYLLKLARLGLIRGVIGGPQCSTLSRLRNVYDNGPRPLRGRGDETRYGLPDLNEEEYNAVRDSNAIWVRMVAVWLLSHAVNQDTMFGGEQPEDIPNPQNDSQPSIFDWPAIVKLQELFDFRVACFDQLVLGHPTIKPTAVLTSNWDLWVSLHELRATEE